MKRLAEENNTVTETEEAPSAEATETVATAEAPVSSEGAEETTGQTDESATDAASDNAAGEGASEPAVSESRSAGSTVELNDVLSSGGEEAGPRKEVEGGRSYEIIYIARIGDESATEATVQRVRELIDGKGGAIDNIRSTEARRLAYPINGENDGIYYVVNARFVPTHMSEIDRFFKLEESVVRHMVLRED
ncbi:MAG TPA: 30S ribosomal protein S6 [Abditibacteriaceae bacterium]